jgi:stage V sporulation protein G
MAHRHPSGLVVTDVQVRPVTNNERLRAWVTITFNDAFVVKGIRIIKGNSRLFVAMPSRQQKDGSFQDVAHPITPEFRTYLEDAIVNVFLKYATQDAVD